MEYLNIFYDLQNYPNSKMYEDLKNPILNIRRNPLIYYTAIQTEYNRLCNIVVRDTINVYTFEMHKLH